MQEPPYLQQLRDVFNYSSDIYIHAENVYPEESATSTTRRPYPANGPLFCPHCASKNLVEIYSIGWGSVAGGTTDTVYQCADCAGEFTFSKDWG